MRRLLFGRPFPGRPSSRHVWLAVALLAFALSTLVAFLQPPRPDAYALPPRFPHRDWWRYPLEQNASMRLPVIGGDLNDLFARAGSHKAWAVGTGGLILHSEDGGWTWKRQAGPKGPKGEPFAATLNAVAFVNDSVGWIVGGGGTLLKTVDGGRTWTQLSHRLLSIDPRCVLNDIFFTNEQNIFIVGENPGGRDGILLVTRNGGRIWQTNSTARFQPLVSLAFADDQRGWLIGRGRASSWTINGIPMTTRGGSLYRTVNGGESWTDASQSLPDDFQPEAVFFWDATHGWIAGNGGILATEDGGRTWVSQYKPPADDLSIINALSFVDARNGWAVGEDNTVLATTDGGKRWEKRNISSAGFSDLHWIRFTDARNGWIVGEDGVLLATGDGGKTWQSRSRSLTLGAVHFPAGNTGQGWMVGQGGFIAATQDGGRTWLRQQSGLNESLVSVFFPGIRIGWAVGFNGTILATTDGGATWARQRSGVTEDLASVFFVNEKTGWAVGKGTIVKTRDGGRTWSSQNFIPRRVNFVSVYFTDEKKGWVAALEGLFATTDGGLRWESLKTRRINGAVGVFFLNDRIGWTTNIVGDLYRTTDGGGRWQPSRVIGRASGTFDDTLYTVTFTDPLNGWAVGKRGTVVATHDGGETWAPQKTGLPSSIFLYSVHFADDKTGWVAGTQDTLLATTDGGKTWKDIREYRRWPAPWYYLTWPLVLLLLAPALRMPKTEPAPDRSVADRLMSDRPLEPGEYDALQFNNVALGLSRFLRNENTRPPLTIAITGEWGSGKSSLMNLLRADLESYGFRPVSFNAWHHQQEEHLLAALLENIRQQAVPPWWRYEGARFRLRLLARRTHRYWVALLALVAVFAWATGYFIAHPSGIRAANEGAQSLVRTVGSVFKGEEKEGKTEGGKAEAPAAKNNKTAPPPASTISTGGEAARSETVVWLLSALGLVVTLWKGMTAFGVNPGALMATMAGRMRIRDLQAQTGFRHRFADEFRDVTHALNPLTMVILIDDLDRCRPENVLTVLEAVNFLVSSGDCFILLGMARERVERCVALGFKDVAEEMAEDSPHAPGTNGASATRVLPVDRRRRAFAGGRPAAHSSGTNGTAPAGDARRNRIEYARNYLEKLINLEVPVPRATREQCERLMVPPPDEDAADGRMSFAEALALVRPALVPLLVLLVIGGCFVAGGLMPDAGRGNAATASQPAVAAPAAPVEKTPPARTGGTVTPPKTPEKQRPAEPAPVIPGRTGAPPLALPLTVGLALLALGWWRLRLRPDAVIADSEDFEQALLAWHPFLFAARSTPRTIKRYMNRVRYYAMRQRPPEERRSRWERLWPRRQSSKPAERGPEDMPEDVLVALSAIEHTHPEWLREPGLYRDFRGFLTRKIAAGEAPPVEAPLKRDIVPEDRERFENLAASVRVSGEDAGEDAPPRLANNPPVPRPSPN